MLTNYNNMAQVIAVSLNSKPGMPKSTVEQIKLLEDWGVEGDYHAGKTVRHRYLARIDVTMPNRRQINLLHSELFARLQAELNVALQPGQVGENITTHGLDLMKLPLGTLLQIGETALLEITEARIPCNSLSEIDKRLLKAVTRKKGEKHDHLGVLAVVLTSGIVKAGDPIQVVQP